MEWLHQFHFACIHQTHNIRVPIKKLQVQRFHLQQSKLRIFKCTALWQLYNTKNFDFYNIHINN